MRAEGVSFRHAVELLREGHAPQPDGPPPKDGTVRKLASPIAADAGDAAALGQVAAYYHQ